VLHGLEEVVVEDTQMVQLLEQVEREVVVRVVAVLAVRELLEV
jgi:hypothetical protein